MEKRRISRRLMALILSICLMVGMLPITAFAADPPDGQDTATAEQVSNVEESIGEETKADEGSGQSDGSEGVRTKAVQRSASSLGKGSIIDGTNYFVTSAKSYAVAPDVTERVITTNNTTGNSQTVANVMEINTANGSAKLAAGYGNRNPAQDGWIMETTTNQAHLYEKTYGENVVGGINASLFNITTGEPNGYLVMKGVTYRNDSSRAFVAVFDDGSVGLFDSGVSLADAAAQQSEKQGKTVTLVDAISAWVVLLRDGKVASEGSNPGYYSRSAIGMKPDGTIVMLQADGTQAPRSTGYTLEEMGYMMKSLGCEIALELDEGGSATFLSQREGESDVSLRNTPAGGGERVISTSILVVSEAAASGTFDHASITPNSEYYTPNASVALEATGIDSSGAKANAIPETVTWKLAEDSEDMGEVTAGEISGNTAKASFTSNGKLGDATINLMNGDAVVGTVVVHIQEPDSLAFASDEINLNYEQHSDLGLVAKYQGEPMNLKAGDIEWSLSDETAGSFDGNTFVVTSNKKVSVSAQVTAKYGELSDTITVNIGKQPTIIMDGGDEDPWDYSNIGTTVESFDGMAEDAVATYHYAGRGGVVKGSVVSDSDEEYADIVRFGHNALRLDYDWTGLTGTDGACLGLGSSMDITGTPTAIGVWVYIPEGVPVPWLRAQIATSTDDGKTWTNAYINFTMGSTEDALKTGWQYLEADLTAYSGAKIRVNSGMLFRAMAGAGKGFGWYTVDGVALDKSQLKGYIILDNISIVYGANNQDVTNPKVNSIQLINEDSTKTDLEDGAVLKSNSLNFNVTYDDNEDTDEFATGIESAYFYFDGNYYGEGTKDNLGSTLAGVELANGQHSMTFYLKDGYGNVTRETRYFTVEGSDTYTNVEMSAADAPTVGEEYVLNLTSNNAANLASVDAALSLSSGYAVKSVEFASGFTGTYAYDETKGKLTISAQSDKTQSGSQIATIKLDIPASIKEGAALGVQLTKGAYTVYDDSCAVNKDMWLKGFSGAKTMTDIAAKYIIRTDTLVTGLPAVLTVTSEGAPAANIDLYADDTKLGTTDAEGKLTTDALTTKAGSHELYAMDADGKRSYALTVTCYDPVGSADGKPYFVLSNIAKDATTEKNISWMSNPTASADTAQIRLSEREDLSDATTTSGKSTLIPYSSSGSVNRVNSVYLTGLKTATTYYYQVGDGTLWSDTMSFTTADPDDTQTDFFLMADIQEEDALTGFGRIAEKLKETPYDFGIQTGDAVDNVRYYNQWEDALNLFSIDGVVDKDMIHVIGNHETDDDGNGAIAAKSVFNIEDDWYSVERGDVYIAVLNHTQDKEKLAQFKQWLVEDAAKSDCAWKILTTHVPVYYTNPTGGGQTYLEMLPGAIEQAGIDMVFTGNDHSYARTAPLTGGSVDEENGVYYCICGSTGGKSYSIVDNPDFHFEKATLDFESVYLSVSADSEKIKVTAYNVDTDGTATVLDEYMKEKPHCENDEHDYVYDRSTGLLTCTVGDSQINARDELYSGWAKDSETGRAMYFTSGVPEVGQVKLSDGYTYYFDANGLGYEGEYTICGETCIFTGGRFDRCTTDDNVTLAGWCGDKAEFVIRGTDTLEIGGSGAMYDYSAYGVVPWSNSQKAIQKVTVADGITCIGKFAFYGMSNISEMTLPDSVVKIGEQSFRFCGGMKTLYLPDGVAIIDPIAFRTAKDPTPNVTVSVAAGSCAESYAISKGLKYTSRTAAGAELPKSTGLVWLNGKLYYVKDGVPQYGLIKAEDGNYYYFGSDNYEAASGKRWVTFPNDTGVPQGYYTFDETTHVMLNPPVTEPEVKAGLAEKDGKYYYVAEDGSYVTGKVHVTNTNGLKEAGYYYFAEDGHMFDGEVAAFDGSYYYFDGGKISGAGLMKVNGSLYYISTSTQKAVVGRQYWPTLTNGLLPAKLYYFADDGRLADNGYFTIGGVEYYFVDYVISEAPVNPDPDPEPEPEPDTGLVEKDGSYYYIQDDGTNATGKVYVTNTNGLMGAGYYYFAEDGHMFDKEVAAFEGTYYYFEKGKISGAGLMLVDGSYYYISTTTQKVIVGRRYWITQTNDLLPAGFYNFGDDGRMIQ